MVKIARTIECDVLVCGGGPAGVAAAVASGRNGVKTILLERFGFTGGICVGSLVHTFDGLRSCRDYGQIVVGGVGLEAVIRLRKTGGMAIDDNPPECVTFDPEAFKILADQMLEEANVQVLYHLFACATPNDGTHVTSVLGAGKEGLWEIRASQFIDCTGDGDISAFAGAEYEKHDAAQAMSMHFRVGGIPRGIPWDHLERVSRASIDAAYQDNRSPKYGGPWLIRIRDGEVTFNCTRLYGDGTNTEDLSRCEREGRRDMMSLLNILKETTTEFRDIYLLTSAVSIGVRETRRILGDYRITAEDVLFSRGFEDTIALGSWPIDIHPADGRVGVHPHKEDPPEPYPIPLRCLLVRGFDNLMTAGRCISASHEAHGSTRVSGTAMALGEAAGTLAAMAVRDDRGLRQVPFTALHDQLMRQGAILALR